MHNIYKYYSRISSTTSGSHSLYFSSSTFRWSLWFFNATSSFRRSSLSS